MSFLARNTFAILAVAGLIGGSASAQTSTQAGQKGFLYLPGVPGGIVSGSYRGWHAVDGYGLEAKSVTRGRTVTRTFSPLAVGTDLGPALPLLVVKCASGQRLPYAIVRMQRPNERRYYVEFRIYDVAVLNVSAGKSESGGGQTLELDYSRMVLTQYDAVSGRRTSRSISRRTTPFTSGKSVKVSGSPSNDYEVFVRVDRIPGSSRRPGYSGWHEASGYDIGVRRPVSTLRAAAVPTFSNLSLTSKLSALPEFTTAALTGQAIRNVEVHVWSKAVTTGPVLVMTLANVNVTKAGSTAKSSGDQQTVELSYGSVQFEYFRGGVGSNQGSVRGGWNLRTNKAQ